MFFLGSTLTTNEGPQNRHVYSNGEACFRNLLELWHLQLRREIRLVLVGWRCSLPGEGTKEEYELPALVGGQTVFEGGHGAAPLRNLVEDVAIGESVHVRGVG